MDERYSLNIWKIVSFIFLNVIKWNTVQHTVLGILCHESFLNLVKHCFKIF